MFAHFGDKKKNLSEYIFDFGKRNRTSRKVQISSSISHFFSNFFYFSQTFNTHCNFLNLYSDLALLFGSYTIRHVGAQIWKIKIFRNIILSWCEFTFIDGDIIDLISVKLRGGHISNN